MIMDCGHPKEAARLKIGKRGKPDSGVCDWCESIAKAREDAAVIAQTHLDCCMICRVAIATAIRAGGRRDG
jgi:hypothetical protein